MVIMTHERSVAESTDKIIHIADGIIENIERERGHRLTSATCVRDLGYDRKTTYCGSDKDSPMHGIFMLIALLGAGGGCATVSYRT